MKRTLQYSKINLKAINIYAISLGINWKYWCISILFFTVAFNLQAQVDYGDAPDSYGTLLSSNGARHTIVAGLHIGSRAPDADTDGFVNGIDDSGNATDDNLRGALPVGNGHDEGGPGVRFGTLIETASSYTMTLDVVNTNNDPVTLIGWIDFDLSGTFDADEAVVITGVLAGAQTLTWNTTPGITAGTTYARFRLSTDTLTASNATGAATDGEVEDYQLTITTTTINPCTGGQDSDGDGINDFCDKDDDNDGILDTEEGECALADNSFPTLADLYTNGSITLPNGITITLDIFGVGTSDPASSINGTGILLTDNNLAIYDPTNTFHNYITLKLSFSSPIILDGVFNLIDVDYGQRATVFGALSGSLVPFQLAPVTGNVSLNTGNFGVYPSGITSSGDFPILIANNAGVAGTLNGQTVNTNEIVDEIYFIFNLGANNFGNGGSGVEVDFTGNISLCVLNQDTDGDGIPDYLDTDSDNDGCPDASEGASGITTGLTTLTGGSVGGSLLNLGTTVDTDPTSSTYGVPTAAGSPQATTAAVTDATDSTACSADLSLTKTVDNAIPKVGQNISYTLTINNAGPVIATGVQVTDVLPAGLSYVSDNSATTSTTFASNIWDIGNITVGQTISLQITATVTSAGIIINTSEITQSNELDVDSTINNGK